MIWFLLGILPIFVFAIADIFLADKQAIIVSIGVGFIVLIITAAFTGFDPLLLIDFGLLFGLGLIAIKLENTRFFKLQPAILSFLIGIILLFYQVFSDGYMVHFLPLVKQMLTEQMGNAAHLDWDYLKNSMIQVEKIIIPVCFLHGAIMLWAAKKSNKKWILGKLSFIPLCFIAVLAVFMFG